jgi:translin
MIDKRVFASLKAELERFDSSREDIIKTTRDVLKSSKAAIYAIHRNDQKVAKDCLDEAKKALSSIAALVKQNPKLVAVGAIHEGMEEFVEASCYYGVMFDGKLPSPKDLNVDIEPYLGGLCDLTGEMVRKAIGSAIDDDIKTAMKMRQNVREIFDELSGLEFRNTPVRRKFDAIKYGLEKLEDLALQLKLKGKI